MKKVQHTRVCMKKTQCSCLVVTQRPTLNKFRMRHARALAQTLTDIISEFGYTKCDAFLRYYEFYLNQFQKIDVDEIMKEIKKSINLFCARRLRQSELPEKSLLKLFPRSDMVWIKHKTQIRSRGGKTRRFQLIHSIAQCKNVLEGPNKEFYRRAYEKHAATLSRPAVRTPVEILASAFNKGKEFGRRVAKLYTPEKGYMPSRSATFDTKRSEGGKKDVLFKKNTTSNTSFRVEPTVLFLHGLPGTGKSHIVNEITRSLCNRLSLDFKTSTYVRNCNTEHWDGYKGQPITILDDWSQDVRESKDVLELIALVTENDYPLPMADLSEKGTLFTSRFIIICSNAFPHDMTDRINVTSGQVVLRHIDALIRRLHHRYYILDATSDSIRYSTLYQKEDNYVGFKPLIKDYQVVNRYKLISEIVEKIVQDSLRRSVGLIKSIPELRNDYPWNQTIFNVDRQFCVNNHVCQIKDHKILSFPLVPDINAGLPKVRTCAVSKPLGTRMVTCGSEELHVLKPFQVAMWKALGTYGKFKATHGKPLSECLEELGERSYEQFMLSGDYESATDGMNMDLSNALLNGILSEISHTPTKLWAVYENGQHEVHYPSWTSIDPIVQTTGQLMGSLLSFPLLCLANDLITDLAGITKQKLINGDDLLAFANEEQIQKWKSIGTICGMKPSVGKNYTSRQFGTFNSQLIVNKRHVPYVNLKLTNRSENIGNCAKIAQSLGISKRLLVKRSHKSLKLTPQSLDVSYEYGGLGYETTKTDNQISILDKYCYFAKLLKNKSSRFSGLGLPKGYEWQTYPSWDKTSADLVQFFGIEEEKLDLIASVKTNRKDQLVKSSLSYSDLSEVKEKINKNPYLRSLFKTMKFSQLPPLDSVCMKIHIVHKRGADATFNSLLHRFLEKVQPVDE